MIFGRQNQVSVFEREREKECFSMVHPACNLFPASRGRLSSVKKLVYWSRSRQTCQLSPPPSPSLSRFSKLTCLAGCSAQKLCQDDAGSVDNGGLRRACYQPDKRGGFLRQSGGGF